MLRYSQCHRLRHREERNILSGLARATLDSGRCLFLRFVALLDFGRSTFLKKLQSLPDELSHVTVVEAVTYTANMDWRAARCACCNVNADSGQQALSSGDCCSTYKSASVPKKSIVSWSRIVVLPA